MGVPISFNFLTTLGVARCSNVIPDHGDGDDDDDDDHGGDDDGGDNYDDDDVTYKGMSQLPTIQYTLQC